ncbi:MAG: ATP-binding cassette domain-containing protein [Anaerolineae bacterium]
MIVFDHVTYTYPETLRPALRDVSLHLPEGTLTLVVGPSGAGKSTLLRCTNGLVPHFSGGSLNGCITVNGLHPTTATPQTMSRHAGFVFQDPEAQFVMNQVEDEIAFALENVALPPQEMRVRVEEVLDLLDLAPLRQRRLETLSGGEKQRVAIAAALALRPRVLVLDEPTSQLDPKSAEDVLQALVRLNTDLGLTILLAEHRLERVLPFVDQMVYLSTETNGALVGPPRQLLRQLDLAPPLVTLANALDWQPLPLTIKEGIQFSRQLKGKRIASRPVKPSHHSRPYLRLQNVKVAYRGQPVLHGVSLDIWPGEIVVLMGRNGSGKTTLLKSLVGLVRPQAGRVEVSGQDIAGMDVAHICRQVGYLPQNPDALLFADNVLEEMMITLRNHGFPIDRPAELPIDPQTLLDRLGLAEKAGHYPRDLSVGERQRAALAAIAVTRPGALLLDEPTRGLDYRAKRALVDLLRGWRDSGMAILLVTHDVEFAAMAADRIALMSQGEIIAAGDPARVLGDSPLFAPQIARLFPGSGWLTIEDSLKHLA